MQAPPVPADEEQRLRALRALGIVDTASEERYDRITRLAQRLFQVPIAVISLVDADRQWFKSRQGLDAEQTAREISFCGHAILGRNAFIVEDASKDARFFDNPLVTASPRIRFYAGYPLLSEDGYNLGTLCLIDHVPRALDTDEQTLLRDLAAMVQSEFAALKLATTDPLTGLSNRRGFQELSEHALALCARMYSPCALLFIDLDKFKRINDEFGHAEGDRALIETGQLLRDTFRQSDVVARLGGDEFCVLITAADQRRVNQAVARLAARLRARNRKPGQRYELSFSVGACRWDPQRHQSISDLLRDADERMYGDKRRKQAAAEAQGAPPLVREPQSIQDGIAALSSV